MPYPLPLTRTEAYLAYKAGVIQQSDLKPSLAVPRNGIDAWLAYWTGLAEDYPKREDGTPHILQEEEAYIAYLCGVINEYPEKCLRRVGAYLRYLISARWGRPDHPLNREELYLSLIKTQFIPSGDPSSDIEIDGTAKAPFVDVKLYGDTSQQTYTGKNLINPSTITGTSKGITYSFDPTTNEITLNGTATDKSTCYFSNENRISLDGEYTLSYEKVSGSITPSGTCRIEIAASSWGSNTIYLSLQDSSASITATKTFDVYAADFNIGQGTVCNNFKIKLQLEKSASATSFEPYVGRQASPNPDYPQAIQTVTGEQTVTVVGKNLLGYNEPSLTRGLTLSYNQSTGIISATGTTTANWAWLDDFTPIKPLPAGTYTFSTDKTRNYNVALRLYTDSTTYSSASILSGSKEATKTVSSDIVRVAVLLDCGSGYAMDDTFELQMESGEVSSSFAPYSKQTYPIDLGSIELCKLGTYQDYIWKDGDDWKVHKATGKATQNVEVLGIMMNNSSGPTMAAEAGAFALFKYSFSGIATARASENLGVYKLDESIIGNAGANAMTDGTFCQRQGTNDRCYFRNTAYIGKTGNEMRALLLANSGGANAYYYLSTPTDTVITNQALINQLNALKQGGAEEGTTYIKVSATDPNLPAKLYVEAPKYD